MLMILSKFHVNTDLNCCCCFSQGLQVALPNDEGGAAPAAPPPPPPPHGQDQEINEYFWLLVIFAFVLLCWPAIVILPYWVTSVLLLLLHTIAPGAMLNALATALPLPARGTIGAEVTKILVGNAVTVPTIITMYCLCYAITASGQAHTYIQRINSCASAVDIAVKIVISVLLYCVATPLVMLTLLASQLNPRLQPELQFDLHHALDTAHISLYVATTVQSALFIGHIVCVYQEVSQMVDAKYITGLTALVGSADLKLREEGGNQQQQRRSFVQVILRYTAQLCLLLTFYTACVLVPIRYGHILSTLGVFPLPPLSLNLGDLIEPFAAVSTLRLHRYIQYTAAVRAVVTAYLSAATQLLGLQWLLRPPPPAFAEGGDAVEFDQVAIAAADAVGGGVSDEVLPQQQQQQQPPQWHLLAERGFLILRCSLLVLLGIVFHAVLSSWLLHLPLLIGRALMPSAYFEGNNDYANYPLGAALLIAALQLILNLRQQIALHPMVGRSSLQVAAYWATKILSIFTMILFFLAAAVSLGTILADLLVLPFPSDSNATRNHVLDVFLALPVVVSTYAMVGW